MLDRTFATAGKRHAIITPVNDGRYVLAGRAILQASTSQAAGVEVWVMETGTTTGVGGFGR